MSDIKDNSFYMNVNTGSIALGEEWKKDFLNLHLFEAIEIVEADRDIYFTDAEIDKLTIKDLFEKWTGESLIEVTEDGEEIE